MRTSQTKTQVAVFEHKCRGRWIRLSLRSLLVLTFVLVPATPALANSLASWVWIWPGVVSINPLFGLLPTLLASFVERPFVTRARVTKRPLIRSIRANVLSLLAGIPVSTFVWSVRSESGLFVLAGVAVAVTIAVEGFYFRSVLRKEDRRLSWRWIIFGNISSNALLIAIALTVRTLQETHPQLGLALLPYYGGLQIAALALSVSMVAVAVAEPTLHGLRRLFTTDRQQTIPNEPNPELARDAENRARKYY